VMAGRMSGRGDDHHACVAEHVVVALELGHGMIRFEARPDRRRPFVLGLLHQQMLCGNIVTLPIWSGCVWETATYLMSEGRTPSCSSCAASVFGRCQCVMGGSAGRWPSGMAAIASAKPVSQRSQPWLCLIR